MSDYRSLLARSAPAEVLFTEDLANLLQLDEVEAEEQARVGTFGPTFLVGGRIAVLRDDLLNTLRLRSGAGAVPEREVLRGLV